MRVTAPPVSIKEIWDAQTALFGVAGSYGLLVETNLDSKVSLAKADLTTLETRLSAARATKLDNLDNIDASLKELFYEHFGFTVDDDPDLTTSGTATMPESLVDNDTGTVAGFPVLGNYVEILFEAPAYIKQYRIYSHGGSNGTGRFKLQAYVAGAWVNAKTGIPTVAGAWSAWTDLTSPQTSIRWRLEVTTLDTGDAQTRQYELELKGVKIG